MSTATAYAAYRGQYVADSVATASPAKLVTMLYDRLALDLTRAAAAIEDGDREASSAALLHAQDIVSALQASLRAEAWSGGPGLASLYDYLLRELIAANVQGSAEKVVACQELVAPLRDAWHEAARSLLAQGAA